MLRCDMCGRYYPALTKMYVMRSDLSVKVCSECSWDVEYKNKLFAKVLLACFLALAIALVVFFLCVFIIIF